MASADQDTISPQQCLEQVKCTVISTQQYGNRLFHIVYPRIDRSKLSINHPEYDRIHADTLHLPSIATRVVCFRSYLASGAQGCNRAADSQLQLTFDLAK